jgi:hypothetical protein
MGDVAAVAALRQPQSEPIAGCVGQVLLDAQVAFGGADRGVAQAQLDLLQPGAALERQLGKGAPAVVRRHVDAERRGVRGDHVGDRLGAQAGAEGSAVTLAQRAEGRCQLVRDRLTEMVRVAHVVLVSTVSRPNSGLTDVEPGRVCLGTELSVGGGGESVSTRAEVVGDGAKRDQETLRVLG